MKRTGITSPLAGQTECCASNTVLLVDVNVWVGQEEQEGFLVLIDGGPVKGGQVVVLRVAPIHIKVAVVTQQRVEVFKTVELASLKEFLFHVEERRTEGKEGRREGGKEGRREGRKEGEVEGCVFLKDRLNLMNLLARMICSEVWVFELRT